MDKLARRRVATIVAAFLFGFYVCWNVWWLSLRRVPPAILVSATGIPSPTTGGTRSFFALMRGEVLLSLYYNPATVPIIVLLIATIFIVARRGSAPRAISKLWYGVLILGFIAKIATTMVAQ